jgi:hypothetical protein
MRSLLLVLAFTYVLLVPVPALAQTSQAGASGDQYDDNVLGDGTANGAVHAALLASGAIQTPSEVAQATGEGSVSAAEQSKIVPSERDAAFAEQGDAVSSAEAQGETASTVEAQGESASMAEAQGESANTSGPEKLPQTGGPSPLWLFGAPLICIGGILARRILLA